MPHFADIQIKYSVDGYGISGIITPQLNFSVPSCEYDDTSDLFPAGAQVILTCSDGTDIPKFYVSSRSYSGAKLNFVCYDRSYTTDREIAIPDSMFDKVDTETSTDVTDKNNSGDETVSTVTAEADEEDDDRDDSSDTIGISKLMSMITAMCGYVGYSDTTGIIGSVITKAKKSDVKGKTCRNILDELSRACCGVWLLQNDTGTGDVRGTLTLISVDSGFGTVFTAEKYADVYVGGTKRFGKITLTNGSESYSAGTSSSAFGTLEIETPYASSELVGVLYGRLKGYTYKAWECSKLLMTSFLPFPSSLITFGTKTDMYVNSCTVSLTSTGIYASVGRNAVSEDETEYRNRTERELIMRYRLGSVMGNTKISKNGIQLVVKDNVNNKETDYGFKTYEGGIAKFAGVIMDGKMPDKIEKVTNSSGKTERRITYGDKTYSLQYDESGDTKSGITFTEVK